VLAVLVASSCAKSFPSLDEQKAEVRSGQLRFHVVTSQAVLAEWGAPTYGHREYTQFFPLENGTYVPSFRVPLGEAPSGWDNSMVPGDAIFLVYADRGELLGFLGNRLVYRERMPAEKLHSIGKNWAKEARFKTEMEKNLPPLP
jgi:hypothetical protein